MWTYYWLWSISKKCSAKQLFPAAVKTILFYPQLPKDIPYYVLLCWLWWLSKVMTKQLHYASLPPVQVASLLWAAVPNKSIQKSNHLRELMLKHPSLFLIYHVLGWTFSCVPGHTYAHQCPNMALFRATAPITSVQTAWALSKVHFLSLPHTQTDN